MPDTQASPLWMRSLFSALRDVYTCVRLNLTSAKPSSPMVPHL